MNLPPFQPGVPALWDQPPPNSRAAGYSALASAFGLSAPRPALLVAVGDRHSYREEPGWRVQTLRYWPGDTVLDHIEFALRYEGVDLAILSALFAVLPPQVIAAWVEDQPTGQYARRTWFLWEWLMRSLGRTELLILDDWGPEKRTVEQRRDLMDIIEDRHQRRSTILTSQLPVDRWYDMIGDPTIADAILDRLVHNAYRIELQGESLRKTQSSAATAPKA